MKYISAENRRGIRLKPLLWNLAVLLILVGCVLLPPMLTKLQDYRQEDNYIPIEGLNSNTGQDVTAAIKSMQSFVNTKAEDEIWQIADIDERYEYFHSVIYTKLSEMADNGLLSNNVLQEFELLIKDNYEGLMIYQGNSNDGSGQIYEWFSIGVGMHNISLYYNVDTDVIISLDLSLSLNDYNEETDLETLLKNYIAWLGLDGLNGWMLHNRTEDGNGFEIIEASAAEVPFVLYVTKYEIQTEDEEIYCMSFGANPSR